MITSPRSLTRFAIASLALLLVHLPVAHGQVTSISSIRITEVMSSSGVGGTADWWEITNFGGSAVTISGWKMDDNSFTFANSVALVGVTSIAPGETAVFLESATPGTDIPNFRSFWTGTSATTPQIGSYSGSGVGLSSTGDGVVLFDSLGSEVTPRVTFGVATTGSSFYYFYDSSGSPATSPNSSALLSAVGTISGQVTFASASSSPANVGSPGTAINAVPEPSALALVAGAAVGGAAVVRRRRLA